MIENYISVYKGVLKMENGAAKTIAKYDNVLG